MEPTSRVRLRRGLVPDVVDSVAALINQPSNLSDRTSAAREAKGRRAELVVFTELALTTFFPRWVIVEAALESHYETKMSRLETGHLFEEFKKTGDWVLPRLCGTRSRGRAQASLPTPRSWSTTRTMCSGSIVRRISLVMPCHSMAGLISIWRSGILSRATSGLGVSRAFGGMMGMCICKDRRWPKTHRVMGLQGVELVALGYETPSTTRGTKTSTASLSSTTVVHAGRRIAELNLGRRNREMWRRGRFEHGGTERYHRTFRGDCGSGSVARRPSHHGAL